MKKAFLLGLALLFSLSMSAQHFAFEEQSSLRRDYDSELRIRGGLKQKGYIGCLGGI